MRVQGAHGRAGRRRHADRHQARPRRRGAGRQDAGLQRRTPTRCAPGPGWQVLLARDRAADRRGLDDARQRRPDQQEQEQLVQRLRLQLLRVDDRRPPGGHQQGRLPPPAHQDARDADDRRLPPAQRRAVPRRHRTRARSTSSRTRPTACTSTCSTSSATRPACSPTTSRSATSTAPARTRAASASAQPTLALNPAGVSTCTFTVTNTGATAPVTAPARAAGRSERVRRLDVYRLTATGANGGRAPDQRAGRGQGRPVGARAGVLQGRQRLGHADGDLGERSVEDRRSRRARRRSRRDGRRHGAGDAVADAGHAGRVRRVHAGHQRRLHGLDDGQRDLDRR